MTFSSESLQKIIEVLEKKPFKPHRIFRGKHAQTLYGYLYPRRSGSRSKLRFDDARLFEIEPGVQLLARCNWQKKGNRREHPTLVLVHGLEGSSESVYMLGTAAKAYKSGFNVVRLNLRSCGDTENLAQTTYNAGLSGDLRAVLFELIERDKLDSIFIAGFSLGGNISLKLAGEFAESAPKELRGIVAVSPSIDLGKCAEAIEIRANWIYQQRFVSSLKKRMKRVKKLYPAIYNIEKLNKTKTVRHFDANFTSVYGGFVNSEDYYNRSSALQFIHKIKIPTLIIQSHDDPFVPFDSFNDSSIAENPFVNLLATKHGGHVGFVADRANNEDRFWAENRLIDFFQLISTSIDIKQLFDEKNL